MYKLYTVTNVHVINMYVLTTNSIIVLVTNLTLTNAIQTVTIDVRTYGFVIT